MAEQNVEIARPHLSGHPRCVDAGGHVCQQTSARSECIESGCTDEPGTLWGPYWCPDHDSERMARISASLESIASSLPPESTAP